MTSHNHSGFVAFSRRSWIIVWLCWLFPAVLLAQYTGGNGNGDVSTEIEESTLAGELLTAYSYFGGSGRGDAVTVVTNDFLNPLVMTSMGGIGRGDVVSEGADGTLAGTTIDQFVYRGGSGRGEASVGVYDDLMSSDLMYRGGSGDGDDMFTLSGTAMTDPWDIWPNNRVLTWDRFNAGVSNGVFSITGTPPTGLRTITRATITTYNVSKTQGGLLAGALAKTNTSQLLIKGDFRSMNINPNTGQVACAVQGSYTQRLWLDRDVLVANSTKCYTDKTLTTTFTGNGTSWYNIQNGIAVKINASGLITELSCQ